MIAEVELTAIPPFIARAKSKSRSRGAKRAGELYESRVCDYLTSRYGDLCVPGVWLRYRKVASPAFGWSYCQPDCLIFDLRALHVSIIEVKLRHCALAWWQLRQLYEPIVRKLFGPDFTYSCCEIVKWYDPDTEFPERFKLISDPHQPKGAGLGVHIYHGR